MPIETDCQHQLLCAYSIDPRHCSSSSSCIESVILSVPRVAAARGIPDSFSEDPHPRICASLDAPPSPYKGEGSELVFTLDKDSGGAEIVDLLGVAAQPV